MEIIGYYVMLGLGAGAVGTVVGPSRTAKIVGFCGVLLLVFAHKIL
ncbi:MAG: hypothetical protein KAS66_05165 [Candidatus Omnitrophica bacterium]|nr:hypothetical protein [Candidatus Omnitrophota bacterium]